MNPAFNVKSLFPMFSLCLEIIDPHWPSQLAGYASEKVWGIADRSQGLKEKGKGSPQE